MPSTPPTHALKLAAAVTFGLVAALALGEIGLRVVEAAWEAAVPKGVVRSAQGVVLSPKELHRPTPAGKRIRPNLDVLVQRHLVSGRDVHVRTNSLGIRGPEIPPKSADEFRILVLGDSITFADYVEEDETYPAYLEQRLRASHSRQSIRVINAGGPNIGTIEEAELLAELAPAVHPDLVLVGFYLNDSRVQVGYPDVLRLPSWLRWSRLVQRVVMSWAYYRHRTHAGRTYDWARAFLERRWLSDRAAYEQLISFAEADWGAAWREESWPLVEAGFRRMLMLGQRYGFRVAMAAFPVRVQVESQIWDNRPQQRLKLLADQLGIPLLDLLPILRASANRNFYDHCHLTPTGNALVGVHLAGFVRTIAKD